MKQGPALRGLTKTEPRHGAGRGPCNLTPLGEGSTAQDTHRGAHVRGHPAPPPQEENRSTSIYSSFTLWKCPLRFCFILYVIIRSCVYIIYFQTPYWGSRSHTVPLTTESSSVWPTSLGGQSRVLQVACALGSAICSFLGMALIPLFTMNFMPSVSGTVGMPDKPFPSVFSTCFLQLLLSDVWRGPVSLFSSPWCF